MAPPTFARLLVLGSGVKWRPCGPSCRFSSSIVMPGSVRTQRASGFTSSTRCRCGGEALLSACVTDWPGWLVPAPLGSTGTPRLNAISTVAATSVADLGVTTPIGSIR